MMIDIISFKTRRQVSGEKMFLKTMIIFGFFLVSLMSAFPTSIIIGYIRTKPVGAQRLTDLIYADVAFLDLVSKA